MGEYCKHGRMMRVAIFRGKTVRGECVFDGALNCVVLDGAD
jgi:hypothetical protein